MTQPPYVGQTTTESSEFGATTVSGSPKTEQIPDSGSATTSVPFPPPPPPPMPLSTPTPSTATTTHVPSVPGAPSHATPGPSNAAAAPKTTPRAQNRVRGPRRARLQLRHIDPWTVLKFSCVLSIALFFVWLIVVGVLYGVLDASGVVAKVNDTVTTINGSGSKAPITAGVVFGGAAIVGVINVVLFIALSTIGSVVYNLCADLVGGVELTHSGR
jgi:hypothetical protein